MNKRDQDEYAFLAQMNGNLMDAMNKVRRRMAELSPWGDGKEYRIALRPDERGNDDPDALMDDIFVRDVTMFRAEQMDANAWWVACYLDNDTQDRICWSVRAKSKPLRIEWVTTEFPESETSYEPVRES